MENPEIARILQTLESGEIEPDEALRRLRALDLEAARGASRR